MKYISIKELLSSKRNKIIAGVALAVILLLVFALTRRSTGNINDTDTGAITLDAKKYTYVDGTYTAHSACFNNEGYAYVMLIEVHNGLIDTVYFEAFDTSMNRYSKLNLATDESDGEKHFSAEVKLLNTSLLQNQTPQDNVSSADAVQYEYMLLAKACTQSAAEGSPQNTVIAEDTAYTASIVSPYNPSVTSSLRVQYAKDKITQINFEQFNEEGSRLSSYPAAPDGSMPEKTYSYNEQLNMLNALPEDGVSLYKASVLPGGEMLLNDYDVLCSLIISKRIPFSPDIYSLFSSR